MGLVLGRAATRRLQLDLRPAEPCAILGAMSATTIEERIEDTERGLIATFREVEPGTIVATIWHTDGAGNLLPSGEQAQTLYGRPTSARWVQTAERKLRTLPLDRLYPRVLVPSLRDS